MKKKSAKPAEKEHARDQWLREEMARAATTSVERIQELFDMGADPSAGDSLGLSPIMLSAWIGSEPHVRILMSAGADCLAADSDGHAAIDWAILGMGRLGLNDAQRAESSARCARLIAGRSDLRRVCANGMSPLMRVILSLDCAGPPGLFEQMLGLLLPASDLDRRLSLHGAPPLSLIELAPRVVGVAGGHSASHASGGHWAANLNSRGKRREARGELGNQEQARVE